MPLDESVWHTKSCCCRSSSWMQAMDSKPSGVQTFLAKLLLDQLLCLTVRRSLSLHRWTPFLVCNTRRNNGEPLEWFAILKNFSMILTGQGGVLLRATKTHDPSAQLIILLFFQKNSYIGICKIKTVYWQMVHVIPSKKTKETQGKQGCQLPLWRLGLLLPIDRMILVFLLPVLCRTSLPLSKGAKDFRTRPVARSSRKVELFFTLIDWPTSYCHLSPNLNSESAPTTITSIWVSQNVRLRTRRPNQIACIMKILLPENNLTLGICR